MILGHQRPALTLKWLIQINYPIMTTTSQSKYLVSACKAIAINKRPAQLAACSVISNFYVRQNIIIISQKPFFTDGFGLYRNFDSTIYVHISTRDTYMWFFFSIQKYLCILFASLFSFLFRLFTMKIFRSQTFSQIGFKIFIRVLCFVWTFPTSFCEWRGFHVLYLLTNITKITFFGVNQAKRRIIATKVSNSIVFVWSDFEHITFEAILLFLNAYFSSFSTSSYLLCVYFILINCYVLICFQFNFKGV